MRRAMRVRATRVTLAQVGRGAVVIVAVGGSACAADPVEEGTELGTARSALVHETRDDAFDALQMSTLASYANIAGCALRVDDGHGRALVSPEMAQVMYPSESPPNPDAHAETFEVPEVSHDPGWYEPTIHARLTTLRSHVIAAWVDDHEVVVHTTYNGAIHVRTAWPWPDGDVILDDVVADGRFVMKGGQLALGSLVVNIQDHVENCGPFGWCNDLMHSAIPDLSARVHDILRDKIVEVLAKPETQAGYLTGLTEVDNLLHGDPVGPRWEIDPLSIAFYNYRINYSAFRDR